MSEFVNNGLRRVRLNEVIRQFVDFRGRTPLKLDMEWGGGEIRALSANNVQMGRIDFSKEAYLGSDALYQRWMTKGDCEKGDVAFTTEAPLGNVAQIPDGERYILSQRVILLKANKAIAEPAYLFQLFQSEAFQAELVRQSTGSTVLGIQQARLARVEVDILPIPQQRQIAEILSTVDEAIEQAEALIAKYQQIKAGLMHDLFTRGVTPDGHLRPTRTQAPQLYKESPLGWIPKEWDCLTIEELLAKTFSAMRSGPFGSALLKDELVENGIPFLGIDNVFAECFVPIFRRFVPRQKFIELIRYAVFPGDVIITIMGTVGRCCVVPDHVAEALSSKHLWTMTFDVSRVLPELVCWQLNHARWVKDWFARYSQGAVMNAIQSSTLRCLRLPVPKIDEQKLILDRYWRCTRRIEMEETHAAKLRQQKRGLMHDLLTGRVRVKVGESASA